MMNNNDVSVPRGFVHISSLDRLCHTKLNTALSRGISYPCYFYFRIATIARIPISGPSFQFNCGREVLNQFCRFSTVLTPDQTQTFLLNRSGVDLFY